MRLPFSLKHLCKSLKRHLEIANYSVSVSHEITWRTATVEFYNELKTLYILIKRGPQMCFSIDDAARKASVRARMSEHPPPTAGEALTDWREASLKQKQH